MKKKPRVVAIFDIGKTNKKLLVFDEAYKVVHESAKRFDETTDEDGFPCEDIEILSAWIVDEFEKLKQSTAFELKAVNFSTYGASLVHVDTTGRPVGSLFNYLKPYPPALMDEFIKARGGVEKITVEIACTLMGHLNSGMQLYWLKKEKPALFNKIAATLHFPQYLSFLLTGKYFAEMTNLGCHSGLWHFAANDYHPWLEEEGIRAKLSPVTGGNTVVPVSEDNSDREIMVGIGLHDSSAATVPYLSCFTDPFVIVSTGTWSISLNPFNKELPGIADLNKGSLCYLSYKGNPVKATMLFAGNDHDQQVKRIAAHFQVTTDYFKTLPYDPEIMAAIEAKENEAIGVDKELSLATATTPSVFHLRSLHSFATAAEAYHQLMADIIFQQYISTDRVLSDSVATIYVDGGFCKNEIYMQLLSNAFPGKKVYATSMIQGTALGAALAIHDSWNKQPVPNDLMTLKEWKPATVKA